MGKGSRRGRRAAEPHPELDLARARGSAPAREMRGEREWFVRHQAPAERVYLCPGCSHEVGPGVAHVVVWAADDFFGDEAAVASRRHWHTECWRRVR